MKTLLKKQFLIPFIVVLVIAGGGYWITHRNSEVAPKPANTEGVDTNTNHSDINYSPPTDNEKNTGESSKDRLGDETKSTNKASGNASLPKTTSMEITSLNQSDSTISVRTMIQTIDNSGTCTLSLNRAGSTTITREVGVQAMPQFSTCKGFDISTSGLTKGAWQISISFKSQNAVGSTSKSVVIN